MLDIMLGIGVELNLVVKISANKGTENYKATNNSWWRTGLTYKGGRNICVRGSIMGKNLKILLFWHYYKKWAYTLLVIQGVVVLFEKQNIGNNIDTHGYKWLYK